MQLLSTLHPSTASTPQYPILVSFADSRLKTFLFCDSPTTTLNLRLGLGGSWRLTFSGGKRQVYVQVYIYLHVSNQVDARLINHRNSVDAHSILLILLSYLPTSYLFANPFPRMTRCRLRTARHITTYHIHTTYHSIIILSNVNSVGWG